MKCSHWFLFVHFVSQYCHFLYSFIHLSLICNLWFLEIFFKNLFMVFFILLQKFKCRPRTFGWLIHHSSTCSNEWCPATLPLSLPRQNIQEVSHSYAQKDHPKKIYPMTNRTYLMMIKQFWTSLIFVTFHFKEVENAHPWLISWEFKRLNIDTSCIWCYWQGWLAGWRRGRIWFSTIQVGNVRIVLNALSATVDYS